jgi:hypothetical protein
LILAKDQQFKEIEQMEVSQIHKEKEDERIMITNIDEKITAQMENQEVSIRIQGNMKNIMNKFGMSIAELKNR